MWSAGNPYVYTWNCQANQRSMHSCEASLGAKRSVVLACRPARREREALGIGVVGGLSSRWVEYHGHRDIFALGLFSSTLPDILGFK